MITAQQPIATLGSLRDHLQYAIGLELTTVPAYLCALYSITPGANSAARETIQSVVLEEMLHMALAANVLNAIGGAPSTAPVAGGPSPVPVYPVLRVPYIEGMPEIHLQRFSPAALDGFIAIEHPAEQDSSDSGEKYGSIGAFYDAIKDGLHDLCEPELFEDARHKRGNCQVSSADYYGGAGTLIEVINLDSAKEALNEIVREGEGLPRKALDQTASEHKRSGIQTLRRLAGLSPLPVVDADTLPYGWKMYSHYARFKEIQAGRHYLPEQKVSDPPTGDILPVDWRAVRPMTIDPKAKNYCDYAWAYEPMMACNRTYTALVDTTYSGFNGEQDRLRDAVRLMYELKYQAGALFNTPSPIEPGRTLGPAFEYLTGHNDPLR
jgi:Ferritin-like